MRGLLLTMTVLSLAFAPAPFPKRDRNRDNSAADLRAMQGEWVVTTYKVHGLDVSAAIQVRVRIVGDRFVWRQGNHDSVEWVIRITHARPSTIDFTEQGTRKLHPGIYRLVGDTLTICTTEPPVGQRPTAFDSSQQGYELMVLKRGGR